MKNYYNFAFLFVFILLIGFSTANLGTYPEGDCLDIKTILNSTQANISTISYPNGSIAVSNELMTKTDRTFNYTFCNTTTLGTYIYDYYDSEGNVYVNSFTITPTGFDLTQAQSIVVLGSLAILLAITFLFFYLSIKSNRGFIALSLLFMGIILTVFLIGVLLNLLETTTYGFPSLASNYSAIYVLGIGLLTVAVVGLIIYLIVSTLNRYNKMRGLRM